VWDLVQVQNGTPICLGLTASVIIPRGVAFSVRGMLPALESLETVGTISAEGLTSTNDPMIRWRAVVLDGELAVP